MAVEPTQEAIEQVIDFASCDAETARRYLKAKNNEIFVAISAILDREDISQTEQSMKWSENDFSADRDGFTPYGPNQPSYNDNDYIHPLGAPTRGSTPVPSLKHPATSDEEDPEIQRALAMSRETDQQETGILSGKGAVSHFGPATRSNYNASQWAVTLPGQEIMPDLEALDRVNQDGEPRCLRPLPSHEYLPNLLTILHSIPLSRKALLLPHKIRSSYGQDSEWWKGHTIRLPRIVSTVDLASAEPATTESDELVTEIQRLMALLDASSRSYGSVDSLLRLDAVNNITSELPTATLVDRVLHAWEVSAKKVAPDHDSDAEVFRSIMGTSDADGVTTPYMRLVPLILGIDHADRPVTLTEALNELLWDMEDPEEYDNYIEHPADVLCIHVSRAVETMEKAGLIIPPSFYIDQYLKENVNKTRGLRKEIAETKVRITNIELVRVKLESWPLADLKSRVDTSALFEYSTAYYSGQISQALLEEKGADGADVDLDLPVPSDHQKQVAEQLTSLYASLKDRLDVLTEESKKATELLARLWQSTTNNLPFESLKHRYWLRGVATKSNVTYILRPRAENEAAKDAMVDDDEAPEGMQWWRIEYEENGTRISKSMAAQDDVIRAVELEYKEALIVYASDKAIASQDDDELPKALRDFIRKDDELFSVELQYSNAGGSGNVNVSPSQQERRLSIDSTTVNFGDDLDPPPYELPAHEITLDGLGPDEDVEVEMIERSHEPLVGHHTRRRSSDATMMGMGSSQANASNPWEDSHDLMDTKGSN